MQNIKSILVTGGAGFIGSHVCENLLAEGYTVISIDNFNDYYDPEWKKENIKLLQTKAKKEQQFFSYDIDLTQIEQLKKITREHTISAIIHLAARAGVRSSLENPLLYIDVNIKGTTNLLEWAKQHKIKNIIMASSSSVYGVQTNVPYHEDKLKEKQISPYAVSKRITELMAQYYHAIHQSNIICLRFFTVYGPRGRPDMAPYKFTKFLLEGKTIQVYGDGKTKRDYTYITDVVEGIYKSLQYLKKQEKQKQKSQKAGSVFEIINIGNGKPIELKYFIEVIASALGKKAQLNFIDQQQGDVPITFADISRAKKILGYAPKVSVEKGMKEFVNWYQKERNHEEHAEV